MSNHYFQFKQFTIHQEHCAMKVTTDACLFGAIVAEMLRGSSGSCLDIGAGTGLLSLMTAQQHRGHIDAIEIDEATARQAAGNFEASPWKEQLHIIHGDITVLDTRKKYTTIFSNPPFFENDLVSANEKKNAAKHHSTLTLQQLLEAVDAHLDVTGNFFVLLPWHRVQEFTEKAVGAGLYLYREIAARQTPAHDFFRGILCFSRNKTTVQNEMITIKDEHNAYTPAFSELLRAYYLYL